MKKVIGTWTSENGSRKLIITKDYMEHSFENLDSERCTYVAENLDFEKDKLFLYPTKENKTSSLDAFARFAYHDGSLFGSIMILDMGESEVEFRKDW